MLLWDFTASPAVHFKPNCLAQQSTTSPKFLGNMENFPTITCSANRKPLLLWNSVLLLNPLTLVTKLSHFHGSYQHETPLAERLITAQYLIFKSMNTTCSREKVPPKHVLARNRPQSPVMRVANKSDWKEAESLRNSHQCMFKILLNEVSQSLFFYKCREKVCCSSCCITFHSITVQTQERGVAFVLLGRRNAWVHRCF